MMNEQVNAWEKKLRDAQNLVEEAGQSICSIRGMADVWSLCNTASQLISQIIGQQHRLRPYNRAEDCPDNEELNNG